jgi:hypothetical protein
LAGTGKLPTFPAEIVLPGIGAPVDGGAEVVTLCADEPALGLVLGLVLVLAVGAPAEHAATARLAAQVVRASAAERYLFIAFLHLGRKSQVPTLNARPTS